MSSLHEAAQALLNDMNMLVSKGLLDISGEDVAAKLIAERLTALQAVLEQDKQEHDLMREALEYYADPDTYFAAGLFPDPPCGDIVNDFSDVIDSDGIDRYAVGKKAREALATLNHGGKG